MTPLSPPDLANAVTSFCTIGAGLTTMLLCRLVAPQPRHWHYAYLAIFVTGIPTLGWHGWGGRLWQVADVGTNLLLAFALQIAVLRDFYSRETQQKVGGVSAVANLLAVAWMVVEAVRGHQSYAIDFGSFGGFYPGEAMLIVDSVSVVALMYARSSEIPANAKPLLRVVVVLFLIGLGLSTAAGDVVHGRVGSYHALWHIVGAFGFLFFWAFNHVRFYGQPQARTA